MKISPARKIAFDVLRRVETEGAFASDLLHARLERAGQDAQPLKPEDAALATELTLGTLRWQRLLDALLEHQMTRPAARLDVEVRLALRLGLYQIRFLERVPAHAAVSQSVELVKRAKKKSAAGLVNAVLRRAASRETGTAGGLVATPGQLWRANLPQPKGHSDTLAMEFSHPTWMVRRWQERFGEVRTVELLRANNHAARQTCIVHDAARQEEATELLRKAGLTVDAAGFLRGAVRIKGGSASATEVFRRGWISIQDEASQMVALLLGVERGHRVLDVCAAPGGKTATLARAAEDALVVAGDLHAHRLHGMGPQLDRLGVRNVARVALDATQPLPFSGAFARILVDAPCSGTGTLARNPEIRWRLVLEDLAELHARQVALLRNALELLAPRGRLVYATCSLEPEENEQVVEEVLRDSAGVRQVDACDALRPHLAAGVDPALLADAAGWFRTFPPEHGTDGFVAAVLEKS